MKEIRIYILSIILLLLIFILAGCGYGELKGTIIDKKHRESYRTTTYIMSGKVMVPITNYYPESWRIQIQKQDEEGKNITTWVSVSESEYNTLQIGDKYGELQKEMER